MTSGSRASACRTASSSTTCGSKAPPISARAHDGPHVGVDQVTHGGRRSALYLGHLVLEGIGEHTVGGVREVEVVHEARVGHRDRMPPGSGQFYSHQLRMLPARVWLPREAREVRAGNGVVSSLEFVVPHAEYVTYPVLWGSAL